MKYTVNKVAESGAVECLAVEVTRTQAIRLARASSGPAHQIYIEWVRPSDTQHGYLNPNGSHEPAGHPW